LNRRPHDTQDFSDEETARRRDAVIKHMLNTPPKPRSAMKIDNRNAKASAKANPPKKGGSQEGMLALAAVFLAGGAVVNLFITTRLLRSVSALLEIRRSITTIPDVHLVGNKR
jgi:hypothetical protein